MSSPFPPSNNPFPSGGQPPNPFGPPPPPSPLPPIAGPPNPFATQGGFPTGGLGSPPYPHPPLSPTRPSILAIASSMFGTLGLLACCCYFLSLPSSIVAVVTGHLALIFINRAGSNLSGKPFAAIGLITGYLGLLVGGGFWIAVLISPDKPEGAAAPGAVVARKTTADDLLNEAEDSIRTDSGGIADGNTDEAKELAREFSELIQELREAFFTKDGGGISLSGDKFLTYCELREGQCAFVVQVPDYRKFEGDAKESLAELAWMAAQRTVADKLKPGDKLAVGMKGIVLYGRVMVGKVADPDGEEDGLESNSDQRAKLLPFFEPEEAAEEPTDGLIELPAEMETPPEGDSQSKVELPAENQPPNESPPTESQPATDSPPASSTSESTNCPSA